MRPDGKGLKHHSHVALFGGSEDAGSSVDDNIFFQADDAGVGPLQSGDQTQRGALAAAARSQQYEDFALVNLKAHLIEHANAVVIFAETVNA